jgi:hypothetical protein
MRQPIERLLSLVAARESALLSAVAAVAAQVLLSAVAAVAAQASVQALAAAESVLLSAVVSALPLLPEQMRRWRRRTLNWEPRLLSPARCHVA